MLPATPQRTAERRLPAPAPITPPEITCVVESGKPKCDEARITAAPAPCAEKPCAGVHLDDPRAHGADDAPAARVGAERDRARRARSRPRSARRSRSRARLPLATSARVMTPIVFWASLVPCASARRPPERTWPSWNPRVTGPGRWRPSDPVADEIPTRPTPNARIGRDHGRDQDLADEPCAEDRVRARRRERRAARRRRSARARSSTAGRSTR